MEDLTSGEVLAKRFFDSDKFSDPWYRRLPAKYKLLWDYLLCTCDHAGIVVIDLDLASYFIDEKLEDDCIARYFNGRIIQLPSLKYFIPKFVSFQYGKLSTGSPFHKKVLTRLESEGISIEAFKGVDRVSIETRQGVDREQEEEKEEVEDKEEVKEKELEEIRKEELETVKPSIDFQKWLGPQNISHLSAQEKPIEAIVIGATKGNATVDKVVELYNATLAGTGKLKTCKGLGSKSIRELLTTFEHLPTLDQWSELFALVKANTTLTGASKTVFLATLDWLAIEDNALKVLSGKYDLPTDAESREKSNDEYLKSIKLEGA